MTAIILIFEKEPLNSLVKEGELVARTHTGFLAMHGYIKRKAATCKNIGHQETHHGKYGRINIDMLEFYKGKKVFVTGHTGFKGSWLCKMLVNAGADVTGYSLAPPTNPSLFEIAGIENDIHSIIGDIRDINYLKNGL
mgnify:CR=1 FL=1